MESHLEGMDRKLRVGSARVLVGEMAHASHLHHHPAHLEQRVVVAGLNLPLFGSGERSYPLQGSHLLLRVRF